MEDFWTSIYEKHNNEIVKIWNDETKSTYAEVINEEIKEDQPLQYGDITSPMAIHEHLDCAIQIERNIIPMKYPIIGCDELKKATEKNKEKKASGPDNLIPELYKAMETSNVCVNVI